jgi:SNF2 family DNA or RNA helicase
MLTATPVQNSLVELFNLLTLLKPGLLQTEALFKKEYVDSKNGRIPKNPDKLRSLMREVMVRNTRALVDVKLPRELHKKDDPIIKLVCLRFGQTTWAN